MGEFDTQVMLPDVLELADQYFASIPERRRPSDSAHWRLDRNEYLRNFFWGFAFPTATWTGGTEIGADGKRAGQSYRRANPSKLKEVFEGYRYFATEADGVWTVGTERSGIKPKGDRQDERWWLSFFFDTVYDYPKDIRIPDSGLPVHITGFLSPKGQCGHLGQYDHEFYATRISLLNGG